MVDDLQLQRVGNAWEVAHDLRGAENFLTAELASIGLEINLPKKVDTVTGQDLRKAVLKVDPGSAKFLKRSVRNLGLDFGGGNRALHSVRARRLGTMASRIPRYKRLAKAGGKTLKLVQTGLKPGMLWAVGVHGISSTHLLRARQLARVAVCTGILAGASPST